MATRCYHGPVSLAFQTPTEAGAKPKPAHLASGRNTTLSGASQGIEGSSSKFAILEETFCYECQQHVFTATLDNSDHAFVIYNRPADSKDESTTTNIRILSIALENVHGLCRDIEVPLQAESTASIPFMTLYHIRERLMSSQDLHIRALLASLEPLIKKCDDTLQAFLEERRITYNFLWLLYPPNADIVSTTAIGYEPVECLGRCMRTEYKDDCFALEEWSLEWIEATANKITRERSCMETKRYITFAELRETGGLGFPLQYHEGETELRHKFMTRGKKTMLLRPRDNYRYGGPFLSRSTEKQSVKVFSSISGSVAIYSRRSAGSVHWHNPSLGEVCCDADPPEIMLIIPVVLVFISSPTRFDHGDVLVTRLEPLEKHEAHDTLSKLYQLQKAIPELMKSIFGKETKFGGGLTGVFMLCGPSGSGKKHSIHALAKELGIFVAELSKDSWANDTVIGISEEISRYNGILILTGPLEAFKGQNDLAKKVKCVTFFVYTTYSDTEITCTGNELERSISMFMFKVTFQTMEKKDRLAVALDRFLKAGFTKEQFDKVATSKWQGAKNAHEIAARADRHCLAAQHGCGDKLDPEQQFAGLNHYS